MNNQDSPVRTYSFYMDNGEIKVMNTTKEMMLIMFRKSNHVAFVYPGTTNKYVWKDGMWTVKGNNNG